jgi:cysteine-rich repeat protein
MRFAIPGLICSPLLLASLACSSGETNTNPFSTSFLTTVGDGDGDGETGDTGETGETGGDGDGDPSSTCGDGVLDVGEQCDQGAANSETGQCTTQCLIASCGDGLVYEGFEECDDGNQDDADGCTVSCTPGVCGDGIIQAGEQCDDNNMIISDECPACQLAFCGDGYIQAGVEMCDDGNLESTDACTSPLCEPGVCGDGIVYAGLEGCDDGNAEDGDPCTNACTVAFCGDGVTLDGVEECDDGNNVEDDGCDSQCIASADPQCFLAYNTFSDANRNKTQVAGGRFCDNVNANGWLGAGWYRFTGAAGTRMSETVIATQMCATHAPGWLNGVHPTLADGVVARQVCFNWSGNQCNWNSMIQVVACPGYYLYNLPITPTCSLRYCGEN